MKRRVISALVAVTFATLAFTHPDALLQALFTIGAGWALVEFGKAP